MRCSAYLIALPVVLILAGTASASLLSIGIVDHDFTFDAPYVAGEPSGAVYDYNGAASDELRLVLADNHYVPSYAYAGILPTVSGLLTPPPAGVDLYPVFGGLQFAGSLELTMEFTANDGPYTNPAGDTFDVSLTGQTGMLRIRGWIGTQGFPISPLYPLSPSDITLLEIEFDKVALLARAGHETADLIEGRGQVKTLLGIGGNDLLQNASELATGATFLKFMLPSAGGALFPVAAQPYDPLTDYGLAPAEGRVSGEAGIAPEPAAMAFLAAGAGMSVLRRRHVAGR